MAGKLIQISDDGGSNYFTFPGGTGNLDRDAAQLSDTVFGQTYNSNEIGLLGVSLNANAVYKGFAGYVADLKKPGTATTMTTESMTLESGKIYKIDDQAKEIWDRTGSVTPFVFFDAAVDHNADVDWVDYLFGRVKFLDAYSPGGAITVTGTYFPVVALGKSTSFTLTMTADLIETTDFATAQANGGYRTFDPGLRTAGIDITGIYDLTNAFKADLAARNEIIIEVNPDGALKSLARGFFKFSGHGQGGDVGALEEETLSASLNVPAPGAVGITFVEIPFGWLHDPTSTLSTSIQKALTAWLAETKPKLQYLDDGVAGENWDGVITEMTLTGGLEAMNEFSVAATADGSPTIV